MPQFDRASGCDGKIRHESKVHARKALRHLLAKPKPRKASVLNVYQCQHCEGWHVGHQPAPINALSRMNRAFERLRHEESEDA